MKLHTVHFPCGISTKTWNQLWAGNHLAHVLTNISKSILWSAVQQQTHCHAQDRTRTSYLTYNFWQNPISISPSHKLPWFLFRGYFSLFCMNSIDMSHNVSKATIFSQMQNLFDSHPTSVHVRTCPLMSTHHTNNYVISICLILFPIHFFSIFVVINAT